LQIQAQFSIRGTTFAGEGEHHMRSLIHGIIAALLLAALPIASQAGVFVGVSVNIAPPVLPLYVQPPCPASGYIWIPGYWAWAAENEDYYWVPGAWALAPVVGFLWTPGYWGWADGAYLWHGGYWGRHVGFYGGINYGFGYGGVGYQGGYWRGSQFYYNRSVTNINTTNITNVYNRTVINNVNVNRVSFNGGSGGIMARPNASQLAAEHERHVGFTPTQRQHEQLARGNNSLRASVNGGRPPIAATPRAGMLSGRGVVAARGADRPAHAPGGSASRSDRPPTANRAAQNLPSRGNAATRPQYGGHGNPPPQPAHAPPHQRGPMVRAPAPGSPIERAQRQAPQRAPVDSQRRAPESGGHQSGPGGKGGEGGQGRSGEERGRGG
jgi:WXXGXW repeat (2 copies)